MGHPLATDLHHEVLDAFLLEESSHHITAISLGDGRAVEHGVRILLLHVSIHEFHLVEAHDGFQAIHGFLARHLALLETESPGIHHRGYGDVEGTIGLL